MAGSVSMRWLVFFVCGALATVGCTMDTQGESGSLSVELVINGDIEINAVQWTITRGGEVIKSGVIDTSANGATASVEAYGLEPGDGYTITMEAASTDEETTCKGSAMFSIEVGQVTEVHVMLNCKLPSQFGGVRVDGEFNICPVLRWADASPLQTSVGNDIDLFAMATDDEGDPIAYMWSSGSGMGIAHPMAQSTTYTCTAVGDDTITILVTDDGGTYCMDMHTVPITCVPGDGDPCEGVSCEDTGNECTTAACNPGTGLCETSNVADGTDCNGDAGMCMGGTCVDKDLCMDVVCEDTMNECTAAVCNPSTGVCETSNVTDGTSCGDGGACMGGTCIEEDLCEGVTCDDTMNECTVGVCNSQTGICDVMNVTDGTACLDNTGTCLAGTCEVGNQCDGVDCSSGNDCVDGGTCNPSNGMCEGGGNQPINTPCETDGVCDGQGLCVGCNDGTQCPDDGNQCTMASCDMNMCGQSNVMNGMVCDLVAMGDGMCEDGTCVAASGCTADIQCDDGDVCTVNTCPDGMCVSQPAVDGTTCDAAGNPGTCQAGICTGLCEGVNCDDGNQCTTDGACNPANGQCEGGGFEPLDTPCDQNGGTACDGAGMCVASAVDYPLQSLVMTVGCSNNVTGDVSILDFNMDVDPGPMSPSTGFTADLGGSAAFVEAFLDAAQAVVPGGVRSAQVISVAATVAVRSGATGADVELGADFSVLENRCSLTGVPCTGAPGQGDCLVIPSVSNLCAQGFADVPVIEGVPNSAGGCTQPAPGTPVPDCDCTACEALDEAGCRPGDPDVPCTKGDQCNTNGFCVNGDLSLALTNAVGNYTAGASGEDVLFGWFDGLTPPVTPQLLSLPAAVFANPPAPLGVRVSAGGLFVALQCLMGVDSGGPNGITTCVGGANDGQPCQNPFDNSNNACVGSDDAGLPCAQESATACTSGSAGECVNADCGAGATCEVANLAATTADALLITFVVP